jgi:hypothetical protein
MIRQIYAPGQSGNTCLRTVSAKEKMDAAPGEAVAPHSEGDLPPIPKAS